MQSSPLALASSNGTANAVNGRQSLGDSLSSPADAAEELAYQRRLEEESLRELLARNRPASYQQRYGAITNASRQQQQQGLGGANANSGGGGGFGPRFAAGTGSTAGGNVASSTNTLYTSGGGGKYGGLLSSNNTSKGGQSSPQPQQQILSPIYPMASSMGMGSRGASTASGVSSTTVGGGGSGPPSVVTSTFMPMRGGDAMQVPTASATNAATATAAAVVTSSGSASSLLGALGGHSHGQHHPPATSTSLPPNMLPRPLARAREKELEREREQQHQRAEAAAAAGVAAGQAGDNSNSHTNATTAALVHSPHQHNEGMPRHAVTTAAEDVSVSTHTFGCSTATVPLPSASQSLSDPIGHAQQQQHHAINTISSAVAAGAPRRASLANLFGATPPPSTAGPINSSAAAPFTSIGAPLTQENVRSLSSQQQQQHHNTAQHTFSHGNGNSFQPAYGGGGIGADAANGVVDAHNRPRGTTFSTILQEFVAESLCHQPAAAAAAVSSSLSPLGIGNAASSGVASPATTIGAGGGMSRLASDVFLHRRQSSGALMGSSRRGLAAGESPPSLLPHASSDFGPAIRAASDSRVVTPRSNAASSVPPFNTTNANNNSSYNTTNNTTGNGRSVSPRSTTSSQPRAWINFPRSRVRAYFGDTPWETLHAQPTLVVGFLATAFIMICTYIMQQYVLEIKDHLGLFAMGSYMNFSSYYVVYFYLEKYSTSFRKISQDKKFYTISNIIKASMLAAITPFAVKHLYLVVVHDSWDTSTLRNLGCVYSIPDFVSLLVVRRMSNTTIFHHVCVVIFNYFSLQNDYGKENVCRCIVVYAAFSTFAYVVNMLLASRFLGVTGRVSRFLALLALAVYVFCCAVNWTWQVHYLRTLILSHDHWSIYVYMILICFVMWDDIVLNRWLLQNFKNTSSFVSTSAAGSMLAAAGGNNSGGGTAANNATNNGASGAGSGGVGGTALGNPQHRRSDPNLLTRARSNTNSLHATAAAAAAGGIVVGGDTASGGLTQRRS